MNYRLKLFGTYQDLPDTYAGLLAVAADKGFFFERAWFEYLAAGYHGEDGSECALFSVESEPSGQPLLLMPMRFTRKDTAVYGAHTLATMGHMENFSLPGLLFDPSVSETADRIAVLAALLREFRNGRSGARRRTRFDVLRLWPVDPGGELDCVVRGALKRAGFLSQWYENSHNQFEITRGVSYEQYLAARSSNHRYNIRRRGRNLEKSGHLEYRLYTQGSDETLLRECLDGYILASVESWKSPGSMTSRGTLELIKLTARLGYLRLGVLYLDGRPIAAQFWIVTGGVGHCMRLAYDEAFRKEAPGVVLTALILEHLLDVDRVEMIDFGYGEDDYKSKWMKESRRYGGFMAFNPLTQKGQLFAAKHILGQKVKRSVKGVVRPRQPALAQ